MGGGGGKEEWGGMQSDTREIEKKRRMYLLKAYSPVNPTGSPQGFSLNQILHKLNTIQNMDILQT